MNYLRCKVAVHFRSCMVLGLFFLLLAGCSGSDNSRTERTNPNATSPSGDGAANGDRELDNNRLGFVGLNVERIGGKIIVDSITVGSPAVGEGIKPGAQLLKVGVDKQRSESVSDKEMDAIYGLIDGPVGQPLYLSLIPKGSEVPVDVELVRREKFDGEFQSVTWKKTGFVSFIPMEIIEQFPGSERRYEFLNNLSRIKAFRSEYKGKRVAVFTKFLFPKADENRVTIRLFSEMDSPVGFVTRKKNPKFFEQVVNNDPVSRSIGILHVRIDPYNDSPEIFGEIEEIMFLDLDASDSMKPLLFDLP